MMNQRVLIVEDEIIVAMDLEAMLAENGYDPVGIAPDTRTALRLAARHPDVAFVDINLRDGPTGIALGRQLAADFGIRVIFTSANPKLLGNGVAGTLGYLSKPYRPDQVKSALDYALADPTDGMMPPPPAALTLFERSRLAD
jgi:AmiR/NasT family two-component response regulator